MKQQKTALIVGMAKSGVAAAKLLGRNGWRVIVNDMKPAVEGLAEALTSYPIDYRLGVPPETLFDGVDDGFGGASAS